MDSPVHVLLLRISHQEGVAEEPFDAARLGDERPQLQTSTQLEGEDDDELPQRQRPARDIAQPECFDREREAK